MKAFIKIMRVFLPSLDADEKRNNTQPLLIASLLGFALFAYGGYNSAIQLLLVFLISALGALVFWRRRNTTNSRIAITFPAALIGALWVLSLLVLPRAVNLEGALQASSVYFATFVFMLILANIELEALTTLGRALFFMAATMAALSLAATAGVPLRGWYVLEPSSGLWRLSGAFQYANAMGVFVASLWLAGPRPISPNAGFGYRRSRFEDLSRSLLVAALLLTLSRGSYLSLVVGVFVYGLLAGFRAVSRELGVSFVWGTFIAIATLLLRLPGLVFSASSYYLFSEPLEALVAKFNFKWHPLFLLPFVFIMLFWNEIGNRIMNISFSTHTVSDRMAYWQVALAIIKNHPLGIGGGGWLDLYPQYQNFAFVTAETHNSFLKIILETGLPGAFLLLFSLAGGLFWLIKLKRSGGPPSSAPAMAALATLLAHAAVDFDWSFLGLWLLTLYFTAAAFGSLRLELSPKFFGPAPSGVIWALLMVTLILSFTQFVALGLVNTADKYLTEEPARAQRLLNLAVRLNPLSAKAHLKLAEAMALQANEDKTPDKRISFQKESRAHLLSAVRLRPQSAETLGESGRIFLLLNDPSAASTYLMRAVVLAPYQIEHYLVASQVAFQLGQIKMEQGDKEAGFWFAKSARLYEELQEKAQNQPPWITAKERLPARSAQMGFLAGQAWAFLGQYERAILALKDARDDPVLRPWALAWQVMLSAKVQGLGLAKAEELALREGVEENVFLTVWKEKWRLLGSLRTGC